MNTQIDINDSNFAIAAGLIPYINTINKSGLSTNSDSGIDTDIWDGANPTDDIPILIVPTTARKHSITSSSEEDAAHYGTLTLTGLPLDTETVIIASKTYTFQTVLTNIDGHVLIGATASESIDNLISAINLGSGSGTRYAAATTANITRVSAAAGTGDTMWLYSTDGTSVATTETLTNGSWGAATTAVGLGVSNIRIYGLTGWDTSETNETIVMQGTSTIDTVNLYVFINKVEVLNTSSSNLNIGKITLTAKTDLTISAQIGIGNGKSQSCAYAIPSNIEIYLTSYFASIIKASATTNSETKLLINKNPDEQLTNFITERIIGLTSVGGNTIKYNFSPYFKITGPAIIKIQANTDVNDTTISAGFDLIMNSRQY